MKKSTYIFILLGLLVLLVNCINIVTTCNNSSDKKPKVTTVDCDNPDTNSGLADAVRQSGGYEHFVLQSDCVENHPIKISKSGITIDGEGYTIKARNSDQNVIEIVSAKNTLIRNITLVEGAVGVKADRFSTGVFKNVTSRNNGFGMLFGDRSFLDDGDSPNQVQLGSTSVRPTALFNRTVESKSFFKLFSMNISPVSRAIAGEDCDNRDEDGELVVIEGIDTGIYQLCGETNIIENSVSSINITDTIEVNIDNDVNLAGSNNQSYGLLVQAGSVNVFSNATISESCHARDLGLAVHNTNAFNCTQPTTQPDGSNPIRNFGSGIRNTTLNCQSITTNPVACNR